MNHPSPLLPSCTASHMRRYLSVLITTCQHALTCAVMGEISLRPWQISCPLMKIRGPLGQRTHGPCRKCSSSSSAWPLRRAAGRQRHPLACLDSEARPLSTQPPPAPTRTTSAACMLLFANLIAVYMIDSLSLTFLPPLTNQPADYESVSDDFDSVGTASIRLHQQQQARSPVQPRGEAPSAVSGFGGAPWPTVCHLSYTII